jgi:tRNA dimethylallyltransferase
MATTSPLITIVGPTASGKSSIAMLLAERFNGEIIAADSLTVYKDMDIGTAKPTKTDQALVRHHLLDIVNPCQNYNVAQFKADALKAITEINNRNKLPILVGGSGLYIDSVLFDYNFGSVDKAKRAELELLDIQQLQQRAQELGINQQDIDFKNRRHLQRAVEAGGVIKQQHKLRANTLVIGIKRDKDELKTRINQRIGQMVSDGFIDEVAALKQKYGRTLAELPGIGYRIFLQYLNGELSLDQATAQFARGDLLLAKRQLTWLRRNKSIQWINNPSEAVALTTTFLNTISY